MPNPAHDPPVTVTAAEFARELVEVFDKCAADNRRIARGTESAEMQQLFDAKADGWESAATIIRRRAARHGVELEDQP